MKHICKEVQIKMNNLSWANDLAYQVAHFWQNKLVSRSRVPVKQQVVCF